MRWFHAGHWLGSALFLMAPLAVVAPKGEVILVAFVALPLLARAISRGSYRQSLQSSLVVVLVLLLLWGGVSALWALDPLASLYRAGTLALLATAGVALLTASEALVEEERRFTRKAIVAGLLVACVLLIVELSAELPLNTLVRRKRGEANNP